MQLLRMGSAHRYICRCCCCCCYSCNFCYCCCSCYSLPLTVVSVQLLLLMLPLLLLLLLLHLQMNVLLAVAAAVAAAAAAAAVSQAAARWPPQTTYLTRTHGSLVSSLRRSLRDLDTTRKTRDPQINICFCYWTFGRRFTTTKTKRLQHRYVLF